VGRQPLGLVAVLEVATADAFERRRGCDEDARGRALGDRLATHIQHPQLGALELGYEKLPIPDADRQTLCIYHAMPGSRSAQALTLLATTTATEQHERTAARSGTRGLEASGTN